MPCKNCNPNWLQWSETGRYKKGTLWVRQDPFVTCSDCGFTRRLVSRMPEKYETATPRQLTIRDQLQDDIFVAKARRDPNYEWRYSDFVWKLREDGVVRVIAKLVAEGEVGLEEVRIIDIGRRGSIMLVNGAREEDGQLVHRAWRYRDPPTYDEVLNHPVLG